MSTAAALHAALLARLRTIPNLTTYDSTVPPSPPADSAGRVAPYAVVWPGVGYRPGEARDITAAPGPELDWPVQVTVASGDPCWTLAAIGLVRASLEGHRLVTGAGPLQEEPGQREVQTDKDTTPPRYYAALMWRALTA